MRRLFLSVSFKVAYLERLHKPNTAAGAGSVRATSFTSALFLKQFKEEKKKKRCEQKGHIGMRAAEVG